MSIGKIIKKFSSVICGVSIISCPGSVCADNKIIKLNYKFNDIEPCGDIVNEIKNWEQKFKSVSEKLLSGIMYEYYRYKLGERLSIFYSESNDDLWLEIDLTGDGNWISSPKFPFCFFVSVARIDGVRYQDFLSYESADSELKRKILYLFQDMTIDVPGNPFSEGCDKPEEIINWFLHNDLGYDDEKHGPATNKNVKKFLKQVNAAVVLSRNCFVSFRHVAEEYEDVKNLSGRSLVLYLLSIGVPASAVGVVSSVIYRNVLVDKKENVSPYGCNKPANQNINRKLETAATCNRRINGQRTTDFVHLNKGGLLARKTFF